MAKGYVSKDLIDPATGERIPVLTVVRKVKDKDFTKIFAGELLSRLAEADSELPVKNLLKIIRFVTELLTLANREDNMIYASVTEMAKKMMLGRDTVHRYIKSFQEIGLIINKGYGKWQLDPSVFSELGNEERRNILVEYKRVADEKTKDREDKNQKKLYGEDEALEREWELLDILAEQNRIQAVNA